VPKISPRTYAFHLSAHSQSTKNDVARPACEQVAVRIVRKPRTPAVTLYKRGRKFSISIWVDGVRHLKSTETTNRREAETIERNFREELNRKRHQIREASPDMSFADLAAWFIVDGSPRPYHLDRLKVLLPHFGEWPIGNISKPSVREYRTARHKEKRLTETTINRDIEVLRHLLYWAVDEGFLTANPLARIRLPKQRRKPRPILNLADEAKLLYAAAPHLRQIIMGDSTRGCGGANFLTNAQSTWTSSVACSSSLTQKPPAGRHAKSRSPRDSRNSS